MGKTGKTGGSKQNNNSSQNNSQQTSNFSGNRPIFEWSNRFDPGDDYYGRVPNPFPGIIPENPNSPIFASDGDGGYSVDWSFLGIEVEKVSASRCHICITFSYTIGFLKYPSSTVCYIKPECQPEIPDFWPSVRCLNASNVRDFFELLDQAVQEGYVPKPEDIPPYCDETPNVPEGDGSQIVEIKVFLRLQTGGYSYLWVDGSVRTNFTVSPFPEYLYYRVVGKNDFKLVNYAPFNGVRGDGGVRVAPPSVQHYALSNSGFGTKVYQNSEGVYLFVPQGGFTFSYSRMTVNGVLSELASTAGGSATRIEINGVPLQSPLPLPPPLPPSPKQSMNKCCAETEKLLRLLLRRVGDPRQITVPVYDKAERRNVGSIAEALTTWSYHQSNSTADLYKVIEPRAFEGASYPMRLTHAGAKGNKPIKNYLQAWEVILRQIDTAVGFLPFKLKIEDTNAAQQGNQSIEIQVHSISDALKLLVESVTDAENDGDVTNNLLVRMAAMLIQQTQVLAKINSQTRNTEEFLDYKVKHKTETIPVTLNPLLPQEGQGFGNAGNLDQNTERATENLMPHLLKNTQLRVKVTEIDEKRLLSEWLYSIEKFVASAAAGNTIHYKGEETLKKLIEGLLENDEMKEFLDRQNIRKAMGENVDLSKFETDAEKGYPSAQGLAESDPDKPYGRPKGKRPKVKRTNRSRR